MGRFLSLGFFLVSVSVAVCSQAAWVRNPQLVVHVYDDAHVSPAVLSRAEQKAAVVLRHAGVETSWAICSAKESAAASFRVCSESSTGLVIRIRPHSLSSADAFGVAFLGTDGTGRYSDVFYDRMSELCGSGNLGVAEVLGHVMAHEIGHLLLGLHAHSQIGIMRAQWQSEDLRGASMGRLLFTAQQARVMRERLARSRAREIAGQVR